ncbi:E3 ubiquitin-protein ligase SHPRH-like [Macrobrachium nipponense]|uniref:E3 ubiquitin-protein ligase SHPRH-like n=1 Tax=Macrobrachium nipponense TaxID=159736 RepID=UPI0030C8055E
MVRNKPQPQQLNEQQQRRAQWNLLDGAGPAGNNQDDGNAHGREVQNDAENNLALLINDELIEDDDNDIDFVPGGFGDPALRQRELHMRRLPGRQGEDDEDNDEFSDADDDEDEDDDDFVYVPVPRRDRPRRERRVAFEDDEIQEIPQPRRERVRRPRVVVNYGDFAEVLENCQFYCKVFFNEKSSKVSNQRSAEDIFCHLGELSLKLKGKLTNDELSQMLCSEFWVYVGVEEDKSAVYFEWASDSSPSKVKRKKVPDFRHCMIEGTLDVELWQGLSTQRYFKLSLKKYDDDEQQMTISVLFRRAGLTELKFSSDGSPCAPPVGKVVSFFTGVPMITFTGEKTLKHDTEELYAAIKCAHKGKDYCAVDVQHPSLIPKLRPYQQAAVRWMLHQEKFMKLEEDMKSEGNLHSLYSEVVSKDGVTFYFNKFAGLVVKDKPLAVMPSPGGILADEMGLGKTVEVLSCMLMHPRKDVPKLAYKEPEQTEAKNLQERKRLKSTRLSDHKDDIFTLEYKSDEDELSTSACDEFHSENSNNINGSDNECSEVDAKSSACPPSQSLGRRKRNSSGHIKVYIPPKNVESESNDDLNKSSRPKRRAAKSVIGYGDFDYFQEEEEEEPEETYKPTKRKAKVTPSKAKFNVDEEIANDIGWSTIESVIVQECWNGRYKDYKKEGSYKEFCKFLRMRKKDPYYMMSLKERLDIQYSNAIAEYSAAPAVSRKGITGFFETKVEQKSFFECICGSSEAEINDDKFRIQCTKCSLWQHANCVQFDMSNPYRGDYICPHCWTQETPVVSGATLIVTPSSISYQWKDEILKHLKQKSIRMLVYKGVATQGYMQPRYLGNFDIVITTYETLSRELNYVDLPHSNSQAGRRFRYPKRFMATPSPLPCVEWWRVCLDEAQMVECTTNKTAEMALRLAATNRWCVTGTPIQKSINDLQGLLMFLGVDPYWVPQWWQRCLFDPYCFGVKEPMHDLVSQYVWRNAKIDVIHQIDIPQQNEEVHWLNFTRVEEHFYQRLHTECSYDARQKLKNFTNPQTKLSSLDRGTLNYLLHPLLKLRQACNHPQVVKGQFLSMNKKTMTMEMLLENLIKKTKVEAEDAHRFLVGAMNGLAGVHIINEEWKEAVDMYREVLRSVEDHSNIKTDSLQRLHTIHNLAEILEANHEGVHPTLRDSTLREEAAALRKRYLQQYPEKVAAAHTECLSNTESVKTFEANYNSNISWWLVALESFDADFVREVRDELLSPYSRFEEHKCILYPVESKVHLQRVLNNEMKKLKQQRDDMIKGILNLQTLDPSSLLDGAIDCHLRPSENEPPQCFICATHEFFEDYEETLFSMKELKHSRTTEVSKETEDIKDKAQVVLFTRKGNWGQSETERILKYLQIKCLGKVEEEIYEDSQTHMQILEAMKKEFKNYRILWRAVFDSVSAMDEVNMATIRLRLRFPDEEIPQQKKKKKSDGAELEKQMEAIRYILEPGELPQQQLKLKSDRVVSENNLRVKLGQLLYLQNLAKTDFGKDGGKNPEPCPICQGDLGEKWAVLLCGHCYCMECMRSLSNRGFNGMDRSAVKCPICRQPTRTREICHVDIKAKQEEEEFKVQGSLSTKMEGVVRLVLKIKEKDPEAKILVFSSWNDVLDVIGDAFAQNGITYRALHQHSKFQTHLSAFKSSSQITALLIPISSGANGLNLIEARHVILVEPILNPAAELQAIGRVHRIGQTMETFVHRFIVKNTIEERMYKVIRGHHDQASSDENTVTIEDLRKLFLHPEELELEEQLSQVENENKKSDVGTKDDLTDNGDVQMLKHSECSKEPSNEGTVMPMYDDTSLPSTSGVNEKSFKVDDSSRGAEGGCKEIEVSESSDKVDASPPTHPSTQNSVVAKASSISHSPDSDGVKSSSTCEAAQLNHSITKGEQCPIDINTGSALSLNSEDHPELLNS